MLNAKDARMKALFMNDEISTQETDALIRNLERYIESAYLNGKFALIYDLTYYAWNVDSTLEYPRANLKLVFEHFQKLGYKIRRSYKFWNRTTLVIKW